MSTLTVFIGTSTRRHLAQELTSLKNLGSWRGRGNASTKRLRQNIQAFVKRTKKKRRSIESQQP